MAERGRDRTTRGQFGGADTERAHHREAAHAVPRPTPPSEPTTSTEVTQERERAPQRTWTLVPARRRTDVRSLLAVRIGRAAAMLSRVCGFGGGGTIGGRVALAVQPDLLRRLTTGRRVVLVTGTNGKTTTTQLTAEALRAAAPAVTNATGDNMPAGHIAALLQHRNAPFAALEVDELHLARVTEQVEPAVIVLLNLSPDQLDRVGEVRTVATSLRGALERSPRAHVIANRDDPNVVLAAALHPAVTWVSAGPQRRADTWICPQCGSILTNLDQEWHCSCGLHCPDADWVVTDAGVVGPDGVQRALELRLPGHINRVNATFALAVGTSLGASAEDVLQRVRGMQQASGRYAEVRLNGRDVRLLLAKNPASWVEMLDLIGEHTRPVLLLVNSRVADGQEVSWLWEVDFDFLAGREVWVGGERALDLAVRLRYAGVPCRVTETAWQALGRMPEEDIDVLANYTAFRDLLTSKEGA